MGAPALCGYAATNDTAAMGVFAIVAIVLVASRPAHALLAFIPVAMWPNQPEVAGLPLVFGLSALLVLGIALGSIGRLRENRKLILLSVGFAAVMAAAFLNHGPPTGVLPSEQRNHLLAFLLGVALVPAAALARPSLTATLRVVAVSATAASAYTFLFADRVAGRALFADYNSDVLGCAAAFGILAVAAVARMERRPAWWLLMPAPVLAFMAAQTRSALVVLAVGLLATWLLTRPGPGRVAAICIGLAVIPFMIGPALAFQRALFSGRDARYLEIESRVEALRLAGSLVRENPLLGVGYRHFPDEAVRNLGVAINAHNDFALLAAENGLPALLLFLCILARVFTFRLPDVRAQAIVRGLMIAAFAAFVFGNVMTDLRMTTPGWVLLGLAWTWPTKRDLAAGAIGDGSDVPELVRRVPSR